MFVRELESSDLTDLLGLMREFAEFVELTDYLTVTEESLERAIFGESAFVSCLVALDGETCVGYALYFPAFKSFRGERSVYLEDLYVSPDWRGRGIGLSLLKAVAHDGRKRGFDRMDWQALRWNTEAIDFYKSLGAEADDKNVDFRLRGEAFRKLAEGN